MVESAARCAYLLQSSSVRQVVEESICPEEEDERFGDANDKVVSLAVPVEFTYAIAPNKPPWQIWSSLRF